MDDARLLLESRCRTAQHARPGASSGTRRLRPGGDGHLGHRHHGAADGIQLRLRPGQQSLRAARALPHGLDAQHHFHGRRHGRTDGARLAGVGLLQRSAPVPGTGRHRRQPFVPGVREHRCRGVPQGDDLRARVHVHDGQASRRRPRDDSDGAHDPQLLGARDRYGRGATHGCGAELRHASLPTASEPAGMARAAALLALAAHQQRAQSAQHALHRLHHRQDRRRDGARPVQPGL